MEKEKKILIVDDDPFSQKLTGRLLDSLPFKFKKYFAQQTQQGLMIAMNELPDLVITDWDMPVNDGISLLKKLRKKEQTKHIPIIMISAVMFSQSHYQDCLEAGAIDFFRKPLQPAQFIAKIKSLFYWQEQNILKIIKEKNFQNYLNSIMSSMTNPAVFYDDDGRCKIMNQGFRDFFETGSTGQNINFYDFFQKDDAISQKQIDAQLSEKPMRSLDHEMLMKKKPHHHKTVLFTKVPLKKEAGFPFDGIFCILRDVSDLTEKYNDLVAEKKRELAYISIKLDHVTEYNQKLFQKIQTLNPHLDPFGKKILKDILDNHKFSVFENITVAFEEHFKHMDDDFLDRLAQKHPDLTLFEKRLSTYLKMNLTTKEIAGLTFSSNKSVEMARYRLRKKFKLDSLTSLSSYLSKV